MVEDLDIGIHTQKLREESHYNIGYREALQTTSDHVDSETYRIGYQCGYNTVYNIALVQGANWINKLMECEKTTEKRTSLLTNVENLENIKNLKELHKKLSTLDDMNEFKTELMKINIQKYNFDNVKLGENQLKEIIIAIEKEANNLEQMVEIQN